MLLVLGTTLVIDLLDAFVCKDEIGSPGPPSRYMARAPPPSGYRVGALFAGSHQREHIYLAHRHFLEVALYTQFLTVTGNCSGIFRNETCSMKYAPFISVRLVTARLLTSLELPIVLDSRRSLLEKIGLSWLEFRAGTES